MSEAQAGEKRIVSLTESRNPRTVYIDRLPTRDVVKTFIQEDKAVFSAVEAVSEQIFFAVEIIVESLKKGGRLIYIGAGTSGRLGVLDASECPPTFGVDPGLVMGIMAGGSKALTDAVEGAEDDKSAGGKDLKNAKLKGIDVVVGITASGFTPYVAGALEYARDLGCKTILLTCNPYGELPKTDVLVNPVVGPEVIAGSTRLKCGTACKLVLNMLSSISMIRLGKVYENLMVDVRATNEKLKKRALRIVIEGGRVPNYQAEASLIDANGDVKTAIYLAKKGGAMQDAKNALDKNGGVLYKALGESEYR